MSKSGEQPGGEPSERSRAHDEPEPERGTSYRAKQLIVLATDATLATVLDPDRETAKTVDELVALAILPACYRSRYDSGFLETFHNVVEITRNLLVGDLPFVINTAAELAALAIFRQAQRVASEAGRGWELKARSIDHGLPDHLFIFGEQLGEELDLLESATVEDTDVLSLFSVPADEDPEEHLVGAGGTLTWPLLRFENWLVPFGNAPRPYLTYDGRAWPTPM